jgi:hypothetical protein
MVAGPTGGAAGSLNERRDQLDAVPDRREAVIGYDGDNQVRLGLAGLRDHPAQRGIQRFQHGFGLGRARPGIVLGMADISVPGSPASGGYAYYPLAPRMFFVTVGAKL